MGEGSWCGLSLWQVWRLQFLSRVYTRATCCPCVNADLAILVSSCGQTNVITQTRMIALSRVYTSATCCAQHVACCAKHVASSNMLRWCNRGFSHATLDGVSDYRLWCVWLMHRTLYGELVLWRTHRSMWFAPTLSAMKSKRTRKSSGWRWTNSNVTTNSSS